MPIPAPLLKLIKASLWHRRVEIEAGEGQTRVYRSTATLAIFDDSNRVSIPASKRNIYARDCYIK